MIYSQLHPRTIEILKNPETLLSQDIPILHNEISRFPYMQSLQALRLRAIYTYEPEKIDVFAGLAAAHSADKKSLYSFIHHEKDKEIIPNEPIEEINVNPLNTIPLSGNESVENQPVNPIDTTISKRENSEENLVETFILDKIIPPETEPIVIEKIADENKIVEESLTVYEEVSLTDSSKKDYKETVEISTLSKEDEPVKLNFQEDTEHKTKITLVPSPDALAVPLESTNLYQKRESEMERLIREVEEKMRKKTGAPVQKQEITVDIPTSIEIPEQVKVLEDAHETPTKKPISAPKYSNVHSFVNTWENWLQIHPVKSETKEINENPIEKDSIPSEKAEIQKEILQATPIVIPEINTGENLVSTKDSAIDQFLENNPKISKYKEDNPVQVGRDRTRDISHLMTETLARIYREQKLYTKAIAGYEILIQKNPKSKEKYTTQIEEIKALRMIKPLED